MSSDKVRLYQKGELSDRMYLKTIYDIGGIEKILEFELDDDSDTAKGIQMDKEADIFSNRNLSSHMLSRT